MAQGQDGGDSHFRSGGKYQWRGKQQECLTHYGWDSMSSDWAAGRGDGRPAPPGTLNSPPCHGSGAGSVSGLSVIRLANRARISDFPVMAGESGGRTVAWRFG
jgi:hypothetical protein